MKKKNTKVAGSKATVAKPQPQKQQQKKGKKK